MVVSVGADNLDLMVPRLDPSDPTIALCSQNGILLSVQCTPAHVTAAHMS
jgi:hypothetical protein